VVDVSDGPDGQRRQTKRRGFKTRRAAQEELDRVRRSLGTSAYVAPTRQSLAEYLADDWLPAVRHTLADSTWESYARNVRLHVVPRLGGVRLQQVDGGMLNRLYADLLDEGRLLGRQSPGLKPRTVRYIHTILSAAFDDAVRWQRLVLNPARRATPPSASRAKAPEMRTWSGRQLARFLELCEGDRYYFPFHFLAHTGCRRGEALGLRWRDIDWGRNVVAIRQTVVPLSKTSGTGREGRILPRTKGNKATVIRMDKATVAVLKTWRARQSQERLLVGSGYQDQDLVFCRPDGKPYHPESFSKTFDRRVRQPAFAELPVVRLHDLRHTWATLALQADVPLKTVSEQLGHRTTAITADIYSHVTPEMAADAVEKVSALIVGP
jgi:integrase